MLFCFVSKQLLSVFSSFQYNCDRNCSTLSLLDICHTMNLRLCQDRLIKIAMTIYQKKKFPQTEIMIDECDKQLSLCAISLRLYEECGFVKFLDSTAIKNVDHLKGALQQLQRTYTGDVGILAFTFPGKTVGHCVVFKDMKGNPKIYDPQSGNETIVEKYIDASFVSFYDVQVDCIRRTLDQFSNLYCASKLCCHN